MIVHICCSVDSWYFLTKLREKYPNEKLKGYFYNPNIHPLTEYQTRLIDVARCCAQLDIELYEGDYDDHAWLEAVRGYESEPEGGGRCQLCFDIRMEKTAKFAVANGEKRFTTTLLMSPKKALTQLKNAMQKTAEAHGLEFIFEDFRARGGTQAQFALAREKQAYFQNYCGCAYALNAQRAAQKRPPRELLCATDGDRSADDRLSGAGWSLGSCTAGAVRSLNDRLEVYSGRFKAEKMGQNATVRVRKYLAWQLISGGLWLENGEAIPSRIVPYSVGQLNFMTTFSTETTRSPVDNFSAVSDSKSVMMITNQFAENARKNNLEIRTALKLGAYDLTPIFIVEKLPPLMSKIRVKLNAVVWEDVREELIVL